MCDLFKNSNFFLFEISFIIIRCVLSSTFVIGEKKTCLSLDRARLIKTQSIVRACAYMCRALDDLTSSLGTNVSMEPFENEEVV